jgi:hypothetical protein
MSEFTVALLGVLSLVLTMVGLVVWRRDRLVFAVPIGALGALAAGLSGPRFGTTVVAVTFLLEATVVGLTAYTLLRIRPMRFGPAAALVGGLAAGLVGPLAPLRASPDLWPAYVLPFGLLAALAVAIVALVLRSLWRGAALLLFGAAARETAAGAEASVEERRATLKMLAEGRITAGEAAELLEALGADEPRAVPRAAVVAILGAMLVVIGFMLPWAHVKLSGREGYQAGYHVGVLGWAILSLGLLPAILACVPGLDALVRQGLLRLLLACVGLAFVGGLLAEPILKGSLPGIGLVVVFGGLGLHLLSALAEAGVLRPPAEPDDGT